MRFNKIRGQTLIEVLITVLFIGISVIALVRFQNYLSYDSILTQQRSQAALLATQEIDSLKYFQVLNTTSGYTAYSSIATGSSSTTTANTTYTTNWTVTSHTNPTYKNISVVVSWTDRNAVAQSVTMVTNIAGIDPSTSGSIM